MKNRIKMIRELHGMNRAEFARKLGVEGSTITQWETEGKISRPSILLLCNTFKININWLKTGNGNPHDTSSNPIEGIGDRLKKLRKALHLTQQGFADKVGCSKMSIVFYERDGKIPDNKQFAICQAVGANYEWFATGEGEMFTDAPSATSSPSATTPPSTPFEFAKSFGCDDVTARIFERFLALKPSARDQFVETLTRLVSERGQTTAEQSAKPETKQNYVVRDLLNYGQGVTINSEKG